MRELKVFIEINGIQSLVGKITGESYIDAVFQYSKEYINDGLAAPISISLPFQEDNFSAESTRCFFESLLPEGFSRRAVADWIKTDEKDYLTILAGLGRECLGAIKIIENDESEPAHYEKLSQKDVKALAAEGATKSTKMLMETHLSLTGASGKVGLYYSNDGNWYMPMGDAPSTHIVKQSHIRLSKIVLNEQLCMMAAKAIGIDVPNSFIINIGEGKEDDVLYATERYDRILSDKQLDGLLIPYRLHQEDFAQAMAISAENKYEKTDDGYMRRMFEIIQNYSSSPIEDQNKLLERIVFNYLIGNTDCHIKNFALLYGKDFKTIRLAPAYDIVATRVYNSTPEMSFYIGGQLDINKIKRANFVMASDEIGLGRKMVESVFDRVANNFEQSLSQASELLVESFPAVEKLAEEIMKTGGYSKI